MIDSHRVDTLTSRDERGAGKQHWFLTWTSFYLGYL